MRESKSAIAARSWAAALLAVCIGVSGGRTLAQTSQSGAEAPLEEVTVTARFRAERLQDTPLAITAVSGDTLAARGETDVTHLAAFVPNTVINPLGAGWGATIAASIRGVGLSDNSLSFEPGVPIYLDGVYLGPAPRRHPRSARSGSRRGVARSAGHLVREECDRRHRQLAFQSSHGGCARLR